MGFATEIFKTYTFEDHMIVECQHHNNCGGFTENAIQYNFNLCENCLEELKEIN